MVKRDWINIVVYANLLAIPVVAGTWYCSFYLKLDSKICNNVAFFSLALAQLWHVFNLPSRKISFLKNEVTQNIFIWVAISVCLLIMLVFYWISPLNTIIGLQKLNLNTGLIIIGISIVPIVFIQLFKRVFKIID